MYPLQIHGDGRGLAYNFYWNDHSKARFACIHRVFWMLGTRSSTYSLSRLSERMATRLRQPKSISIRQIYGRLNLTLISVLCLTLLEDCMYTDVYSLLARNLELYSHVNTYYCLNLHVWINRAKL